MPLERLQKIIAAAGIASRRKAEELIQSGLVSVNGATITELGSKADPETDSIRVNNKLLTGAERREYVALNKPRGYVTTVSDPEGRPTVMELVRSKARLYPIGRLDFNSEGLLLLTNDGEVAHKLMKAASHIPKTYLVKVAGQPAEDQLRRLRAGISIAEERDLRRRVKTAPAQIRVIKEADNPWLEVTLHEGRNRQIRKMFEEIGHHVEKIRRVRYGPLELDLPPGESRALTAREVAQLHQATELPRARFGDRSEDRLRAAGAPEVRRPFRQRDRRPPRSDSNRERPRFPDRPQRDERPERRFSYQGRRQRYRDQQNQFPTPAQDVAGQRRSFQQRHQEGAGDERSRSASRQKDDREQGRVRFSDRPRRQESGTPRFVSEPGIRDQRRKPGPGGRQNRSQAGFRSRTGEKSAERRSRFSDRGQGSGRRSTFSSQGRNKAGSAPNRKQSRAGQDRTRRPGNSGGRT